MPSHQLPPTQLKTIGPNTLIQLSGNDLVELWKEKLSLDIWFEIGAAVKAIQGNRKVSATDKLDCLVKVGELALKIKRANNTDRSSAVQVNVVTVDPTSQR